MQKTVTGIQAIFLPATNNGKKVFFKDHKLGVVAILCAVFSYWLCVDMVLHKSKVIVVF